ncbi:PIN domain-containing protein [Caulobacter endophyticus]|uniref:PIN domain-containing protein n=1 Tax=Caulobacter endophyticus TaxID=2172652 RepID=UPI00240F0FD2|nr:PIN domain-containing protein [Caulobacter endophyticus]MDG2529183.1 PIN domain-containing protein [Caulobacter endophyticus]
MAVFLDTNVLIYSISEAPEEAVKRAAARTLLDRTDGVLSVQVLQEFYVQATRSSRPGRLEPEDAAEFVRTWTRFKVQDNTLAVLLSALEIKARYGFSYWDSAVIAAARAAGCTELFTEDLSHGQIVEGVRIVNPFQ